MIALSRMSKPRCKVATSNLYNVKFTGSNVIHGFEATHSLNLHDQAHLARRLASLVRAKYCFGFHQPPADLSNLRPVAHVMKHHVYCADLKQTQGALTSVLREPDNWGDLAGARHLSEIAYRFP